MKAENKGGQKWVKTGETGKHCLQKPRQRLYLSTKNDVIRSSKTATFTEIETTLDEEMARVRAQMLEELVLDSASADWRGKEASERPKCPLCGTAVQANGEYKRQLVTEHEQNIELRRRHGRCPKCGASFFPPG